tara:strand:- start:3038 stop:3478 length:441 start_codon:yes stop_codon:yes gene_type:complete
MLSTTSLKTGRLTFKKSHRLLSPTHYQAVFDNIDVKQGGNHFTFLSKENQHNHSRLGLIVAKKHIPLAVNRNKIKRAVRESFRLLQMKIAESSVDKQRETNLDGGEEQGVFFDTIVLVKSNARALDKEALNKELKKQWLKLMRKQQ